MSLLSSAKWNACSQFFKIFIQLINMVYLATIIPPSQYGIMAMAAVIMNLGVLLRDLGTASAIIQKKDISDSLINAIYWFNLAIGLFIAVIVSSISPLVANIYREPSLTEILVILSVIFPISSSGAAHLALLERESKFRIVALVEIASSFSSVVIAIILAKLGYGVYSLVFQSIIMNSVSALLFWKYSGWAPKFFPPNIFSQLKEIFGFSANLSIFNIINYFARNADSFIVGKFMSAAILGNYNLAYRIMLFPLASLTFVFGRSLYPIMSRSQDDVLYIKKVYLQCVFWVLFFSAPIMSGLAYFSSPFISIVFGKEWMLTSQILIWLAPTAILQSVISTTGAVFSSKGRTDILLVLGIIGSVLQVASFIIGVQFDIVTFAKCYFIANIINFFPPMVMALKLLNDNLIGLFKVILPVIISTSIMIVALCYLNYIKPVGNGNVILLVSESLAGALIYFISIILMSNDVRHGFFGFVQKFKGKVSL